jgi:hypothetical protein
MRQPRRFAIDGRAFTDTEGGQMGSALADFFEEHEIDYRGYRSLSRPGYIAVAAFLIPAEEVIVRLILGGSRVEEDELPHSWPDMRFELHQ